MNCKTLLKSALSLAIGFAVSSATATDTEIKAIDFESPAYTADTAIGTYAADGWTVGADDASQIKTYATAPAQGNSQYLELDTGSSVVSNALTNASDLNTAISNSDVAYFDYDVKFTPATSACSDISNGASKLAFYALVANNDTNLVVVTKDGNGNVIHETTSARVDCTQSVAVHVEITTTNNVMAYSVKVGDTQATSLNAVDADGQTPGQWFRTMNTGTIAHCNFSGSGDIDNFAYGTKVAAAPAQPLAIQIAGNKGTISPAEFLPGESTTFTLSNVAEGFTPIVLVDGTPVAVANNQFTASPSESVLVAYVKDTAWYLDPALRNQFTTVGGYSPIGTMIDANEQFIALDPDPGGDNYGAVLYDAAAMKDSVDPKFGYIWRGAVAETGSTSSFRQMAVSAAHQAVFGCPWYATDNKVWVVPFDTTKAVSAVDIDWGESENLSAKMYWGFALGDYVYYKHGNNSGIYKFSVVKTAGEITGLKFENYVGEAAGTPFGKIVDNIPYAYTWNSTSIQVMNLDTGAVITNEIDSVTFGSGRRTYITGVADGTPHIVIHGDSKFAIYALDADLVHVVGKAPIWSVTPNGFFIADATYASSVAFDDETKYAYFTRGMLGQVWEKAPAKYIVRATFSDEANAEDDILVPAGAATNVTFSAPAGYDITSVKVNGTAVPAAGFTSAAYTYSSDAVNGHVYIAMTTEKTPTVIRLAGGTQVGAYADLTSAFAAAQAGDTIKILADQVIATPATNNVNVTFDLNGFAVTGTCAGYMIVNQAGTLTMVNGNISGDNVLLATGGKIDLEDNLVMESSSGWEGIKFTGASDFVVGTNALVGTTGSFIALTYYGTGTVDVYGTVTNGATEACALYMDNADGTINIYDGAVITSTKGDAVRPDHGTLNVYGGSLFGNIYTTIYAWDSSNVHVNIYGGDIDSGSNNPVGVGGTGVCTLGADCKARFKGTGQIFKLIGIADICAPGYAPILEDGWYVIKQPTVIRLAGGVQVGAYADIDSAFEAAQAGDTIQLLADQEIEWGITVSVPVTLDLAGFDITRNDDDPWDSMFTSSANITFNGNGGTIDGGILRVLKASAGEYLFTNVTVTARTNGHIQMNDSSVVLTVAPDATFSSVKQIFEINEGTLNVYGTLSHTDGTYPLMTFEDATVNVYTGAVISCSSAEVFSTDDGVSTVNIYGGTITGADDCGVFCCEDDAEATLNLYGGTINGKAFDITVEGNPVTPLTDSCTTLFSTTACIGAKTLADYCANGYAPVLEGDYYVIKASAPASTYPTYIDIADDDMKEAYDTWAQTYNVADGADYEDQFLMNVDPETDVDNAIKITGIEVDGTSVTVTVADNLASIDTLANINGEVIIKGATSLAANATWTQLGEAVKPEGATVVFDDVNIGDYKFIKAFVVNPYVPAPSAE